MVNFLNFEYVLTIHKAGTIRAAADELYISPQALSEHLGKLERELGTPLFHRTKPLTLTEAGEEFLSCAEACLEARRRLDTKLSSIAQRDNQRIALGVPTGMPPPAAAVLPGLFPSHPPGAYRHRGGTSHPNRSFS